MHRVGGTFLRRLVVRLGVVQHDVPGAHDVLQRIQQFFIVQQLAEHCVVHLQVVDAFHLSNTQ